MANRTGTYVAFDALGEVDPTKSDFRFFSTIEMWSRSKKIDFKYTDSHAKTFAVRDSSQLKTLKARICERLSASKNVVVIISEKTRKTGSMLSYEIEKAVDLYKLPLIVTYTGYDVIASSIQDNWPDALALRLNGNNATGRSIHIPFKKDPLFSAINYFTCSNMPKSQARVYLAETYVKWGLISKESDYRNVKKRKQI